MENLAESVELHDKYQMEVKFTYPLDRERDITEYHVETYMFIPNNLCINDSTYSREEFFNDMQKYIRFKTPAVLMRVLDQGENAPLAKLAATMKALAESREKSAVRDYEERLKMFCSILKSALRDEESFLERSKSDANFKELSANYLKNASEICAKFRAMKILAQAPTVEANMLKLFEFADEFISITVSKYLLRFALFLKSNGEDELRRKVLDSVDAETLHRSANHQPSVPKADSDNEEFLYREGVLKKIMASVLFLRTSTKREGKFLEQFLFGLAAGLAMAFATFIAFYSRTVIAIQDFSISFFLILVIAYMFKDRIKEISRNYLSSKLHERLYDYRTDIFNAMDRKAGICKESFGFIPESKLPQPIARIRNKDFFTELENGCLGENIILSRKSIQLFTKGCERIFSDFNVDGVVDIMRFNMRGFLEKMDNPTKDIQISKDGEVESIKGKRVYHIDMIIHYGMEGRDDSYRHFRLVLARNGIKRIEQLPIGNPA